MVFVSFHAVDRRRIGLLPKLITLGNRPESVKEDDSDWGFLDDLKQEYRWSTFRWPDNIIKPDGAAAPCRNGRRGATPKAPTGDGVHAKSVAQANKTKGTNDIVVVVVVIVIPQKRKNDAPPNPQSVINVLVIQNWYRYCYCVSLSSPIWQMGESSWYGESVVMTCGEELEKK